VLVDVCALLRADEEELVGIGVIVAVPVDASPGLSHGLGYIGLYKVSLRRSQVLV